MTDPNLEQELRDHFATMETGSPARAAALTADAIDRAPAGHWGLGRIIPARRLLAAGAAVAIVAALAVATVPLWRGSAAMPGASITANSSPSALSSPGITQPTPTPVASPPDGMASRWGTARNGWLWAIHGSSLEISKDHGRTWKASPMPRMDGSQAGAVAIIDASHFWILAATEYVGAPLWTTIFRTADAGATWQSTDGPGFAVGDKPVYVAESISVVDSQVGFAVFTPMSSDDVFHSSTVMRTLDGGATWSRNDGTAVLDGGAYAVDRNTLWMTTDSWGGGGSGAALQVSHDAGATWTNVPLPGLSAVSAGNLSVALPTFLTANEGFLVAYVDVSGVETRYYRTVDGGQTWTLVATQAGQAAAVTFIDATHWMEGEPLGIGREITSDAGKTWTTFTALDPNESLVFQYDMADTQNGVGSGSVAATLADGTKLYPLYLTWDSAKTWHPAVFPAP
jgi:photosystem II stability/assembly factor-like uncharacterized protein